MKVQDTVHTQIVRNLDKIEAWFAEVRKDVDVPFYSSYDVRDSGLKAEAIAAVPDAYLERNTLLGPPARIRDRWAEGIVPPGVTGLIVSATQPAALDLVAELADIAAPTPTEAP